MEEKSKNKRTLEVQVEGPRAEAKRQKVFSAEQFRKELNSENLITSLKEFINLAQQSNNKCIVEEYLEAGGSVQEMLLLLDETARTDLTSALPVFRVLHLIFLSIKGTDSQYYDQAKDGTRFLLNSFMPTVQAMMDINSNKHRKTVLKVLTSVVTLFPAFAKEIMSLIPTSPTVLTQFLRPQSGSDSVRKWFIFFILSFIINGDFTIIHSLLNMKGLFGDIINDLKSDEAHTVNMFLSVLQQKVLENIKVSKTLKLKIFNTQVVLSLFELYNWKSQKNINPSSTKVIKVKEVNPEDKELVTESVHSFLLVLCTSKKFGIVFVDHSFGTTGEVKNNLLLTVIQSLSEFWENKRMSEIIIRIVTACPDLMKVTLSRMESAIQPRESKKWNNLLQFLVKLLESMSPKDILKTALEVSEIDLIVLAKQFCTPGILIHNMSLGIRNTKSFTICYYSMKVITLLWRKTEEVLSAFKNEQKLKKSLTSSFSTCILDVDEVLTIWENVCSPVTLDSVEKQEFLNLIVDFLEMSAKCERDVIDSPSRIAAKMLQALDVIHEALGDMDYVNIRSRVYYLLTSVDPMSLSPDSDLFRRAITVLMTNKSKSAIESVTKIALSTGVFENNESEIDIWLACYFDRYLECQDSVPEIFAECISRLYLKEVDFDQNFIKSSSKNKSLFTELMNIDTTIILKKKWISTLAESPTPMLVQFLELLKMLNNSDKKKKLKEIRNYISHVTLRLYHYYYNNLSILKSGKDYKNEIADSILNYVEGKSKAEFYVDDSNFFTSAEKNLMCWIINRKKPMDLDIAFNKDGVFNISLFMIFNTVTSYLVSKVESDSLDDEEVPKLCQTLVFFINFGSKEKSGIDCPSVLSYDVENLGAFRLKCMKCFFSIPLVDKFDVCEYKDRTIINFTKIICAVISVVDREYFKTLTVFQPWKAQLLNTISSNLIVSIKTLDVFGDIELILNQFSYTSIEISDILNQCCSITDVKNFVSDEKTMPTMVLTEFVKLQCDFSAVDEKIIEKLQSVMKSAVAGKGGNFEIIDTCFIYLLRKHPKSLAFMDNEFLEALLRRSDFNDNIFYLGRLLLNDPEKVRHFVKFATDHFKELKNKKLIVALTSALLQTEEDNFLDVLMFHKSCFFWRERELKSEKDGIEIQQLTKMIYKNYKGQIFKTKSKDVEFVLHYSTFFSVLTACYLDKENILDMKENISYGLFKPEIIHKSVLKYREEEELLHAYSKGLLTVLTEKLKEVETGLCEEKTWDEYSKYVSDLVGLKSSKWSELTKSAEWKDFIRLSLRFCFNYPKCPSLLKSIRCFIELVYEPGENCTQVKNIFEMFISHSQFLSVMLQETPLKGEVVKFYYSLIKRNSEVLSIKHIPVILASYSASLSENDMTLLKILRFYEEKDLNMAEYEPLIWGEPAVSHYSVKTNVEVSLWRRVNMMNVLELLDARRLEVSLKEFPVNRSAKVDDYVEYNDKIYDPAFLLPIFSNLLSPGSVTYCLPFIQKGCFAYTICSLSSTSRETRICGCVVLARFYNHLELVQNMKLKSVWLHFINCLRFGIADIGSKPLPSVVTYFLARMSMELSAEPGEMFTSLQKFLLAKPVFNFDYIPEFLPLFHSSDVHYMKHRRWILEVMRDGFKRNADLDVFFQTMAVKMILSYFRSQFCNRELKLLVLEVVTNTLKMGNAKLLISEYGLLSWLNAVCLNCDRELLPPFVKLVSATIRTIKTKFIKYVADKTNVFYPIQILNILMKVLHNVGDCRSATVAETFLSCILDCLMILQQFEHREWCKLNRVKLNDLTSVTAKIIGEEGLLEKYENLKYFFLFCDVSSKLEDLYRKIIFLWNFLSDRK